MSDNILVLSHLSKRFGAVQAVQDLSLEVRAGEIFGFLGPNGAGKTTTISLICGLVKPDGGSVALNGVGKRSNDQLRARIGVCPQSIMLWEKLTCIEQLEFIGEMYSVPRGVARQRGEDLLAAFGLAEKRDRLAATLSGGMQRRLNLALALVHEPDLLALDEPEAGLDPQSRVMVREYIREWAKSKPGRTVIFTTHNMDEADRLVDRLAIIDQGRLLVLDTPEALKRQYGQGDVLEMTLKPDGCAPEVVLSALGGLAGDARYTAGRLEIRRPGAVDILLPALDAMRQAGLTPTEIHLRENTLEDVFIALTGRGLRE
jgi:ABC-2 type transport system ATP-binding protein